MPRARPTGMPRSRSCGTTWASPGRASCRPIRETCWPGASSGTGRPARRRRRRPQQGRRNRTTRILTGMNAPRQEDRDMSETATTVGAPTPLACEWTEEGVVCGRPASYRTHYHWCVCRGHGAILMVNHGIEYLVDLEPAEAVAA